MFRVGAKFEKGRRAYPESQVYVTLIPVSYVGGIADFDVLRYVSTSLLLLHFLIL